MIILPKETITEIDKYSHKYFLEYKVDLPKDALIYVAKIGYRYGFHEPHSDEEENCINLNKSYVDMNQWNW